MSALRKLARSPFFLWFIALLFLNGQQAAANTILSSMPFTFVNGQVADATQVNANFQQIVTQVNAGAAASGSNNDITALNALATPLTQAQGGNVVYLGGTSTGSANVQATTVTIPSGWTLVPGKIIGFPAGFTNSTAMTLQVNAGLAKAVLKTSPSGLTALTGGEVTAGNTTLAEYDGTEFVLLNQNLLTSAQTWPSLQTFTSGLTSNGPLTASAGQQAKLNGIVAFNEQTLVVTANAAAWDMSQGADANVTNGAGLTFNLPTNILNGSRGNLRINNSTTAPIALTWNGIFAPLPNANGLLPTAAPGITYLSYWVSGGTIFVYPSSAEAGNWVTLNKITISNVASISDTTSFTSAFCEYEITLANVVPATTNVNMRFLPQVGGTFQGAANVTGSFGNFTSSGNTSNSTSSLLDAANMSNAANSGMSGTIYVANPASTTTTKMFLANFAYQHTTGTMSKNNMGIWYSTAGAVTGFQLIASAGNLSTGTVVVRGRTGC